MADVKAAIQLLCSTLNLLLKTNLVPEYFRSAKFDKEDKNAIREFWIVLQKLLFVLGPDIYCSKDEASLKMKLQLGARGYDSIRFYALPMDNSRGSREILLALGWLLAQEDVIVNVTHEKLRNSVLCKEFTSNPEIKAISDSKKGTLFSPPTDESDHLNYIMWLAGRIGHLYKEIVEVGVEQAKYTSKVHTSSTGASGLPHLSVAEVELVNNPKLLERWLPELKDINSLLDLSLKWIKRRHIFWEWMETVVEQKEKAHSKYQQLSPEEDRVLEEFLRVVRSRNASTRQIYDLAPVAPTATSDIVPRFICDNAASQAASGEESETEQVRARASEKLLQSEQQRDYVISQLNGSLRHLAERISVHVISDQKPTLITDPESEENSR